MRCVKQVRRDNEMTLAQSRKQFHGTRVSLDLQRLLNGQVGAIFIDEYSKIPVIETLKKTSLLGVPAVLEKVFALVG